MLDLSKTPDFINPEGVKWWNDQGIDSYAKACKVQVSGFLTELPTGERTYVLVTKEDGVIFENQSIEAIGAHIDMMKSDLKWDL